MFQPQPVHLLCAGFENVVLWTNWTLERYDDFLTEGINRGVSDLGEELFEVLVGERSEVGETGERNVVAHAAQCFFPKIRITMSQEIS